MGELINSVSYKEPIGPVYAWSLHAFYMIVYLSDLLKCSGFLMHHRTKPAKKDEHQ